MTNQDICVCPLLSYCFFFFFFFFFFPFPQSLHLLPIFSQVRQRAADVKEVLDLVTLLNEGGAVRNMINGNFDFKQFQVNYKRLNELNH